MSENKNEDTKTIWLNADFLNVLKEVDRWDYLFTSTLEKVAEHFAKENNLKVDDSHHAHGVEFRQVGETHEVGFHLCTQLHLNDEALKAYESERDEEWNKLPEEQRKRIETREYLRSTEPWSIPEWNDYARIEQKGKRFRGAPMHLLDLNPDAVYMIEADLRGAVFNLGDKKSANHLRADHLNKWNKNYIPVGAIRVLQGIDLTGAKIPVKLLEKGNRWFYVAEETHYDESQQKKTKRGDVRSPWVTVTFMSRSAIQRLASRD